MQRSNSETASEPAMANPVLTTEALSRALIANLPGGAAFVVDRDLRYLLAEGEALATAGFKPEDLVGQTIFEALPPDLAASYEPLYRQALAGEPFEHEHNAHNHTYISRGTPLRAENDEIYAVLVVSYDISERKRVEDERKHAEVALRESEAKYRSLFDSIDAGFCIFEMLYNAVGEAIDFRYIETNPAFERQSGRRPQPGQTMRELFPEAEDMWLKDYAEVARTGQSKRFIDYHVDPDRWFDVFVFSTHNGGNQLAALFSDVTDEKRAETALRGSEAKYRSLFTSINEGFNLLEMISDESGHPCDFRIVETNPAWEQQTGLTDAVGKTLLEIAPNFEQQLLDFYNDVLISGKGRRTEYYTASIDRWYTVYASRIGGEGSRQVAVVFNDISDRKRTEEQQAFLLKFSDALRAEPDADAIANRAIQMLIEHLQLDRSYITSYYLEDNRADVNYQIGNDSVPPLPDHFVLSDFSEALKATFEGTLVIEDDWERQGLSEAEKRNSHNLGMRAMVAATLRRENHPLWSMVAISSRPRRWMLAEIALVEEVAERTWVAIERARAEAALRESELQRVREQSEREQERQRAESLAELDRAKTLFFSNISHEFRTPLTLLLNPLQDVLSDRALPTLHRERLELAQRNSLRLLKLVNTLLDFSRIEAGRMEASYEPTDLSQFTADLASVFRSAIEQAGLRLTVDCLPLPEAVYVDREMWEKIVLNLISNAFKFTLAGEIIVRLHPVNHHVILEIEDTGSGIAPEELPHVFERFHQVRGVQARSQEGSGIGLALVYELVQLQGGTIHASSTLGQGSCFTISLPFGSEHLPLDRIKASQFLPSITIGATPYVQEAELWRPLRYLRSSAHPQPLPDSSNARVLLVDDNTDMRDYLTRILSESVQVEAVADGVSALAAIQRQLPDLVLTDVMMPGLDGFGLLQTLRANPQTREIPILLLSARAGEEAIVEGLEAGADDYLIKPFSAQELISRVNAHLQIAQLRTTALREARSTIQSRDELLSTVSHELNTPLVSILGWTRLLRSTPPSPAILTKALDTIERNATVQAALVQDLLDISRITVGKLRLNPQPVELTSILETVIATVVQTAEAKTIDLVWQSQPNYDVQVMGDLDRLQQVFCNLLTNAIKFTPEGGSVTVELSTLLDQAEIRVRDTGIGIAADFLPHVFDRFRQARPSDATKGLGVGLAIAHHIVNLHGGTIQAESAGEEQGATFIIHLPLLASMTDEQFTQSEV